MKAATLTSPEEAKGVFWFIAFLLLAGPCLAAPPPDADLDGAIHGWFEHQHSVTGAWCCKLADGHILAESDWLCVERSLRGPDQQHLAARSRNRATRPAGQSKSDGPRRRLVDTSEQRDRDPLLRAGQRTLINGCHA
jgi:hypothetical protein